MTWDDVTQSVNDRVVELAKSTYGKHDRMFLRMAAGEHCYVGVDGSPKTVSNTNDFIFEVTDLVRAVQNG